jgi:hypothetical protein
VVLLEKIANMYLLFSLSMLWFPPPPDYCGLQSVICPHEDTAYIQEYIRDKFNKAGLDGDLAVKIAYLESKFKLDATNINTDGSRDRGVLQINSRWHPEVSDECAYDLTCSVKESIRIVKDSGWSQWSTNKLIK